MSCRVPVCSPAETARAGLDTVERPPWGMPFLFPSRVLPSNFSIARLDLAVFSAFLFDQVLLIWHVMRSEPLVRSH